MQLAITKDFPTASRMIHGLLKRKVVTARSLAQPNPLSDNCYQSIEDGELSRRDVAFLLRAREAEITRGERRQRRGR